MTNTTMKLDTILDTYHVDTAHARQVADHVLALFDAVAPRYELPAAQRRLLEIGALLHNVGLTTDPEAHHIVGRDIVLRHQLEDLTARERSVVACMVAFHRKKVRPSSEPAYLSLGPRSQAKALRLAAILRVADGLDYAQSQGTRIEAVEPDPAGLSLRLSGPHANDDGARAIAKADLWSKVFGEELRTTGGDGLPDAPALNGVGEPGEAAAAVLSPWYAAPEAPLAELGRVLLRRHLRQLLNAERKVRASEEPEAVHALRVATRRLRATMRLLGPVGPASALRAHGKATSRLARAAGALRDRDVLLADLAARAPELPESLQPALAALVVALEDERRDARAHLCAALDDADHAAFIKAFAATMNDSEGWDEGPRVRDLSGSTLWRHYEALRAHDRDGLPLDDEALHAMRVDGKRMRYVIELFADTLGPRADEAAKPLVAFQDHLGALNDLAVARALLAPHAADDTAGPGVAAYLALREQQCAKLRAELPARWDKLNSGTYRRKLMELIVKL